MASDKQLYEARKQGMTYDAIRDLYHLTSADSVRSRVSRYARKIVSSKPNIPPFLVRVGNREPAIISVERFVDIPVIHGDLIATGDWQLPTTDWYFSELIPRFGEKYLPRGRRTLAIVGDLVNMDGASKYEQIVPLPSIELELAVAEALFDHLFAVFDVIYYSLGNHEYRLLKALNGALTETRFGRMLSKHMDDGKLIMTAQSQMHVVSNGVHWRLTHPRNYSRNKGIVASQLAIKHQINIVSFHEHHAAVGRDVYNRYTWINGGGLFDPEKMAYVTLTDSTSPVMSNGFVYLNGGTGDLLTPYPTMTAWDRWGIDASLAIAAAEARQQRLTRPDAAEGRAA